MPASTTSVINRRTRIAVLDDHAAVRLGLERVLQREPGFRLVAAVHDERELFETLAREPVDVVVLDYELARGDGLAVSQKLKQRDDPPRILIYSAYAGPGLLVPAAIAQADAVVNKSEPVAELLDAIRRIARGERLLPMPAGELLAAATARIDPQDAPVIPLLMHGATMPDIAEALSIGEHEATSRARRILGRLNARRRTRRAPHAREHAVDDH